jgi:hypothetical protein
MRLWLELLVYHWRIAARMLIGCCEIPGGPVFLAAESFGPTTTASSWTGTGGAGRRRQMAGSSQAVTLRSAQFLETNSDYESQEGISARQLCGGQQQS